MTPTIRAQYRAARTLALHDRRAARLERAMLEARTTLRVAARTLARTITETDAPWPSIEIPGYRVTFHDESIAVEPTATPIPHDWTQTTMDDWMDA